jgi:hypothetical protein
MKSAELPVSTQRSRSEGTPTSAVSPGDALPPSDQDAKEWAVALARVKTALDARSRPAKLQEVPPPPVTPSPVSLLTPSSVRPVASPALSMARAKSSPSTQPHPSKPDEDEEWEWALSVARSKAKVEQLSRAEEAAEWRRLVARAKRVLEPNRDQAKKRAVMDLAKRIREHART